MAHPCNTNYYDYISECADYDQITSDAITSSTTSTTTTSTSTEAADEEASFWQWFGPVLGVITVAGIGVTVRYLSRLVTGLLGRRRQERDIEAQPRPWLALPTVTPPPGYDSVVEGSDNRYEDHELDSNQDSFPLESLSEASTPPTPPAGRYLANRTIYHGRTSSEISAEVSQMIQQMFAEAESSVSSERDLSTPDPERRMSSMVNETNRRESSMDLSSIYSGGSFQDAVDNESKMDTPEKPPTPPPTPPSDIPPPRRGLQPRSSRNPNPKYRD